jgi:beta-ribofuranosylaminobenzene 5'-phosphate synthase
MQDNSRSVRLRIPYRLHLGFYRYRDLPYLFGSTGVAVREPYLIMRVSRTEGGLTLRTPTAESEKIIAGTLRELNIEEGLSVEISGFLRHHVGLGSRTKLVMGLLKSLKTLGYVRENNPIDHLAKKLGVGRVSGIGIYTFLYGGFIADTGVFRGNGILKYPELLVRLRPPKWKVLIVVPEGVRGFHEREEEPALSSVEPHENQAELYTLFTHLITSVRVGDFRLFSKALSRIQLLAGQYFSKYQGGIYSSEESSIIAETLSKNGVAALGQSSWGPAIYGFVEDGRRIERVIKALNELSKSLNLRFWLTEVSGRGHYIL